MKKLIAGFLAGLLAASVMPVMAETIVDNAKIYLGRTKLTINGTPSPSQTLLYNDTMYIPMSEAARQLGFTAVWNATTNTTNITLQSSAPAAPSAPAATPEPTAAPPAATPAPSATPAPIRQSWLLGETIRFTDGTEVTVRGISELKDYTLPNGSVFQPGAGKKYIRVDFDVLSSKAPENGRYIAPLGFVTKVITPDNIQYSTPSIFGDAPQIAVGVRGSASVFFTVEGFEQISRVSVKSADGKEEVFVSR